MTKEDLLSDLKSVNDEDNESLTESEQAKMINDQFQQLFDYDPAMRKVIPEEDIPKMSLEDKYHIINAYMRGGGVRGLIDDDYALDGLEGDEDLGDLTEEEKIMVEEEFERLYHEDARFKIALEGTKVSNLSIRDKYELIMSYSKRSGVGSDDEGGGKGAADGKDMLEDSVKVNGDYVQYRGRVFKRVQLDAEDDDGEDYLMDEQGNIYDTQFQLIGRADDDDDNDGLEDDLEQLRNYKEG